jgi:molybdopterin-binding protein
MNRIEAIIAEARSGDGATLLRLEVNTTDLFVLIIEVSVDPYFEIGHRVRAHFKETSVFLFKHVILRPSQNCFEGTIVETQKGELFDYHRIETPIGKISSIFPRSITHFSVGESVTVYLPPHDITLWDLTGSLYG